MGVLAFMKLFGPYPAHSEVHPVVPSVNMVVPRSYTGSSMQ